MNRGRFITLEGVDGAGKTTQLKWLEERLTALGIPLCVTREPGGTSFGEQLRDLLLGGQESLTAETETLLMFAARREHIARVIEPALAAGRWVLCDRFTEATYAYQSGGSGVDWAKIGVLEEWVQGGLRPDLTLYFDIDPAIGRARAGKIKAPDRFEREREAFYDRVRDAYLRCADLHPDRFAVLDASRLVPEVQADLQEILRRRLQIEISSAAS